MRTKAVQVLWGYFFLWSLHISSAQTIYPGIKARVTQRALDYGESSASRNQATAPQVEFMTQAHIGLSHD